MDCVLGESRDGYMQELRRKGVGKLSWGGNERRGGAKQRGRVYLSKGANELGSKLRRRYAPAQRQGQGGGTAQMECA